MTAPYLITCLAKMFLYYCRSMHTSIPIVTLSTHCACILELLAASAILKVRCSSWFVTVSWLVKEYKGATYTLTKLN